MVWRSDHGTLVFSDLFTWLPYPLKDIGQWVNYDKGTLPDMADDSADWAGYCLRDADIVRRAVTVIVDFIADNGLGNWQPTGAGSAYSMWRHSFLADKPLVHDDELVLGLEREAMHTGRAEAWKHGKHAVGRWFEVDMRSAYTWIAKDCDLPAKLKFKGGSISVEQYEKLSEIYAICAKVRVKTKIPIVPYDNGERTLWPVGNFVTSLWDVEIDQLLIEGASVEILQYATYVRKPVLKDWAVYCLAIIFGDVKVDSEVVRRWVKHCGRALIGRLSLRIPMWEYYGENVLGITGISHDTDTRTGVTSRMLHVGNEVFLQSERKEADDSLPQITGWIMAECRMRLWRAMNVAGHENIAHVDTDSVLVNAEGLRRMREWYGERFDKLWQIKGNWAHVDVYGPRNYRTGRERKISGVPRKAREHKPGHFTGELWLSIGNDMESGRVGTVTIRQGNWRVRMTDPRRRDATGAVGETVPISVGAGWG